MPQKSVEKTRSPRLLRIRVSTALTVVALALLAGSAAYLANYEPLVHGPMSGLTPGTGRHIETYSDAGTLVMLEHQEGESFSVMLTLHNDGPLPVRIERVGEVREEGTFFPVGAAVHPGERYTGAEAIPVEKWPQLPEFTLGAGEERRVAIEFQFGSCNLGRGASTWVNSVPLRFSVLGLTRNVDHPLPYTLAMGPESRGACP